MADINIQNYIKNYRGTWVNPLAVNETVVQNDSDETGKINVSANQAVGVPKMEQFAQLAITGGTANWSGDRKSVV